MELPIEILFRVASFCKYYKTLGNLLLISKDLREYIEAYPKCKEKLKLVVCENVNKFSSNKFIPGTLLGIYYISYYILPNRLWHGECKTSWKPFTENPFIQSQCFFKDGKLEGENKRWWNNGQLSYQCFYKNAMIEGEYKNWYENGQLWVQSFYKDGKLEGESKDWYENGQLFTRCFYKGGELEGEYKEWYGNGQLRVHCFHKNGVEEGEYKSWCWNGDFLSTGFLQRWKS